MICESCQGAKVCIKKEQGIFIVNSLGGRTYMNVPEGEKVSFQKVNWRCPAKEKAVLRVQKPK